MPLRMRGGRLITRAGRLTNRTPNARAPTDADLGFVEASFNAATDQAAGTYMFTAQVLNASTFTLQGYSFSNFRRTAGFSKLTGGTATATTRPFVSAAMVVGDAASTSVTISADFTGPTSGTIAATIPGTIIAAGSGTGTVVHQFTLHNTSASTLTPRARLGLAFEKAVFPSASRLKVRDQATQTDVVFAALAASNTWADGSIRSSADAGLVMEDSNTIAAGSSRVYEAYIATGSQSTSGFNPWTWIAAASDFTVDITSRTGSSTGAMGNLAFSLKTAIATTTRREVLCDTSRFVRIKCWQKLSGEEHLICEFNLDFWLNGSAVPVAVEFAPVLTQHWWVANPFGTTQAKESQTYTATVKYGATTLDTRAALAHAYSCRWASLRSTNDAQHARKHWIDLGSTALPTVRVQYADSSLKKMMKTGYIPPLRLGVNYTGDLYSKATTYTPLGLNGHRGPISQTGGYVGRGMWTDPDSKLVSLQGSATAATAETAWRASRVMAQAGMSVYLHVRDHRAAVSPADTTNKLIPQAFRQTAGLNTQTYTGLPAAVLISKNGFSNSAGFTTLTYDAPAGGTGTFNSYDNAHAPNFSAPMAFLEGESYLAEAAVSMAIASTIPPIGGWNSFAMDHPPIYCDNTARRTTEGIPNTTTSGYGTNPSFTSEERFIGWPVNNWRGAWCLRADNHIETPLFKNHILNMNNFFNASLNYLPAVHRNKGCFYVRLDVAGCLSPWMVTWQGMASYLAARVFDFLPDNPRGMTAFEEIAHLNGRYNIAMYDNCPYAGGPYRSMWCTDFGGYTTLPTDEYPNTFMATSFASNVGTATPTFGMHWQNGDKVRFGRYNDNLAANPLLSGLDYTILYYMVQVSGNTFKLATTPGGSSITIGDGSICMSVTMQDYASITPIGPYGTYFFPNDDGYHCIAYATFEQCIGENHADLTSGIITDGRAFFAPKVANYSDFAPWNFDGSNLLTETGGSTTSILHSFTLTNTSSSVSTAVYYRLGLAFEKGDVPAGSILKVREATGGIEVAFAAAAAPNFWSDGSLRSTGADGMVMLDSNNLAASASRSYEVYAVSGTLAASGFNPWTWIAANNDFTVDLSNRKVWRTQQYTFTSQTGTFTAGENWTVAGSATPSGTVTSWSGGVLTVLVTDKDIAPWIAVGTAPVNAVLGLSSGATGRIASITYLAASPTTLAYSLKTAISTTTRREIVCDTARFVRVKIWQKSASDEHLIVEYHLDFWLNGSAVPVAVEFAPVLSQHWWVANPFGTSQVKDRQIYDAVVKNGPTTLDTRAALHHAYYCRWASLRTANDAQHARKHWINHDGSTPLPTLRVTYSAASLKKMMKAGYIPPLRLGVAYTENTQYPSTHDPLGMAPVEATYPHMHRGAINGTGGYAGRGMWPDPDSRLVSLQGSATAATAETAWRKSRVMAQAGLSVFVHVRDHRSAAGINGGTDAPNRLIPARIRRDATQTYSGLGALAVYAKQIVSNDTGTSTLTHVDPVGGTGGFTQGTYDSAHCVNYSGAMAFLEGESYLGDAVVSQFNCQHYFFHFNEYNHNAYTMYWDNAARQAAQSIPATAFGTIIHMHGEERSLAWSMNAMNAAYMVRADAHPEQPFVKDMVRNADDWLSYSYNYLTTAHRAKGLAYHGEFLQHWHSPWMGHWQGLASDHARRLYDFLPNNARGINGFEEVQLLAGRYAIDLISTAPGASIAYRTLFNTDAGGLVLIPAGEHSTNIVNCSFSGSTGTATPPPGYAWANGDKFRFSSLDEGGSAQTNPTGVDTTTLYVMTNVSGNTFRLATAAVPGTPITVGNVASVEVWVALQGFTTTPLAGAALTGAFEDGYEAIAMALFETCIGNNHVDMTTPKKTAGRAWFAPKTFSSWATWNYDGDNLL